MESDFTAQAGAGGLLGIIGGLLYKRGLGVEPVLTSGTHEIEKIRVTCDDGVYEVFVRPKE